MQVKSAIISDLIFLRPLFILVICTLEDIVNFEVLSLSIGIMTYLLDSLFIIMLI